jgi:hypothetical protein
MRKSVADELKLDIKSYNKPEVKAVNGNKLQYYEEVSVKLSVKSENIKYSVIMPFLVVKELPTDILLGFDTLSKLKINIDCSKRVVSINENRVNCVLTDISKGSLKGMNACIYVNCLSDRNETNNNSENFNKMKNEEEFDLNYFQSNKMLDLS